MVLLIVYITIALLFSFLCSIGEAVLLSVTTAHIALLEQKGRPAGPLLRSMKENINKPLAAILTLNTIAHTVGAAGAGAQAAVVFGSAYVGIASAVLTLLILVFSEIIPKTLGALYWRQLAGVTAHVLRILIWLLYPFVVLSEKLTGSLSQGPTLSGFSRGEFAAMAELSSLEGELAREESDIFKNLLLFHETLVSEVMTPAPVVFSLPEETLVKEYFQRYDHIRFSRVPVYRGGKDQVDGFVLRNDLLLAQARGNTENPLKVYLREIPVVLDTMTLARAFDKLMKLRAHIMLVVDEYGGMMGIITLEDILETLLGLEIIDEEDKHVDMRHLARRLWKRRARKLGQDIDA